MAEEAEDRHGMSKQKEYEYKRRIKEPGRQKEIEKQGNTQEVLESQETRCRNGCRDSGDS